MMYAKAMIFCVVLLLASCGDGGGSADSRETPRPDGEHVWKSQTDMLDKARAIEDTVMEQSTRQRQTIDELAR
jgi:predicted ATPase